MSRWWGGAEGQKNPICGLGICFIVCCNKYKNRCYGVLCFTILGNFVDHGVYELASQVVAAGTRGFRGPGILLECACMSPGGRIGKRPSGRFYIA